MSEAVLKKQIELLEKQLAAYQADGMTTLYFALNRKLMQLAESIDGAKIDLTSSNDKGFDRLMKAMVESRSIAENLDWLKLKLAIKSDTSDDKRRIPLVENFSNK